jgi:hypothetical protein
MHLRRGGVPLPLERGGNWVDLLPIGDGIVPLASALGRHRNPRLAVKFDESRQWVGYGINHLDLLSRPEVYVKLRQWLAKPA